MVFACVMRRLRFRFSLDHKRIYHEFTTYSFKLLVLSLFPTFPFTRACCFLHFNGYVLSFLEYSRNTQGFRKNYIKIRQELRDD